MNSKGVIRIFMFGLFWAVALSASAQLLMKPVDRENYTKEVQSFFEKGNWEAGREALVSSLKKYPKDSDLKMLYGKYYLHHKKYDQARYELVKALEYNADNLEAKQVLVNVEMESGRYSSAICYVNELLEVNPYWRGLWRKKIQLYEMQGNVVEANRLRKRISQIYPDDGEILKDYFYNAELQAIRKRKDGKYDESIPLSKELITQYPGSSEYYMDIINDYIKVGDIQSAYGYIERALNRFPGDEQFINKKVGLLSAQKRYDELLPFLQDQIKKTNSATLRQQYNYYLVEAAQQAKSKDPEVLYGKILERNPGDNEAFSFVFNRAVANQQYEEALRVLNRYRRVKGDSKSLMIKEMMVYQRMGNEYKVASITKRIFEKYPNDFDLKEAYANIMLFEAKQRFAETSYTEAIHSCNLVKQYGDEDMYRLAQNLLYTIYMQMGDYNNALITLNEIMEPETAYAEQYVKRAEIYRKQNRYVPALTAYEYAIKIAPEDERMKCLGGYSEMAEALVKEMNEVYRYDEAMQFVERWLKQDSGNLSALRYAVNLSFARRRFDQVLEYTEKGLSLFPQDLFFKIKMAEIQKQHPDSLSFVYGVVHSDVIQNPYHRDLLNVFVEVADAYSARLRKQKQAEEALSVLDTALRYVPESSLLKYDKGLAYEQLHRYDSAYYYQSFYKPTLAEMADFQHHLDYLQSRAYRNELGYSYLRSRRGDDYTLSTLSSLHYMRTQGRHAFVGRINYAGRESGAGLQFQLGWMYEWTDRVRTNLDAAWAFRYFPKFSANASVYRDFDFWDGFEGELGGGYRRLPQEENLIHLAIGGAKTSGPWRIQLKLNNFSYEDIYLYSLSANVRYSLSIPKNFVSIVGSFGSSPDMDLIDAQFYNGFDVLNTMLGAGFGRMLTKNVTAGFMGTWYNYKAGAEGFKNMYNLYFNVNVAF